MSKIKTVLVFLISLFTIHYSLFTIFASHCPSSDYDCQISEIQREIDALSSAHETNKQELSNLNKQLVDLKNRISVISKELTNILFLRSANCLLRFESS